MQIQLVKEKDSPGQKHKEDMHGDLHYIDCNGNGERRQDVHTGFGFGKDVESKPDLSSNRLCLLCTHLKGI